MKSASSPLLVAVFFIVALPLAILPGQASPVKQDPVPRSFWLSAGFGPGTFGGSSLPAVSANLSFQSGRHVASARIVGAQNIGDTGGGVVEWQELGFLYGRGTAPGTTHTSAAVGVAVGRVRREVAADTYEWSRQVSLPFEAQLSVRPTTFIGLALYSFASIGREASAWGLTVSVQLGAWRTRARER